MGTGVSHNITGGRRHASVVAKQCSPSAAVFIHTLPLCQANTLPASSLSVACKHGGKWEEGGR